MPEYSLKQFPGPGKRSCGPGKIFLWGLFREFLNITLGPVHDIFSLSLSLASGWCTVPVSLCV